MSAHDNVASTHTSNSRVVYICIAKVAWPSNPGHGESAAALGTQTSPHFHLLFLLLLLLLLLLLPLHLLSNWLEHTWVLPPPPPPPDARHKCAARHQRAPNQVVCKHTTHTIPPLTETTTSRPFLIKSFTHKCYRC